MKSESFYFDGEIERLTKIEGKKNEGGVEKKDID